jgi:glycosyltransferase involved in cell wall biosynthesis
MRISIEPSRKWDRERIICFSHLRWNFVFQRPQHLLTRFARHVDVVFFEEPVYEDRDKPVLNRSHDVSGVQVLTPILCSGTSPAAAALAQRKLLDEFMKTEGTASFVAWYYTPMALAFSRHLHPSLTVYDCMDELSAFDGAPPELVEMERELFNRADVVFTGGNSLYEAKCRQHKNVHAFPSSIDHAHFGAARQRQGDPQDQKHIARPRIGFFGVIDERLDRELLGELAAMHPEWQFLLVGPVVKVRQEDLPRAANIHYLGQKSYAELPRYISNWDVAMLPFARNASTRFISPTKTPEYLAAGKPVVSTSIRDVVNPYGTRELVSIADTAGEFAVAIDAALQNNRPSWLKEVDAFLALTSWDRTFQAMSQEMQRCRASKVDVRPMVLVEPEKRVANF